MKEQIPVVGESIEARCTKCRKATRHLVVSVVGGSAGRVQCTVCEGVHNYRNPRSAAKARPRKAAGEARGASAVLQEWEAKVGAKDARKAVTYGLDGVFRTGDLLDHRTFGLGLVRKMIPPNKIEVHFREGIKRLVCGS